ncbi:nucleotide sugar dehydrogenase [Halomarina ordinaria]|uniref:UDP-N-acetyl-D-mannosamine dehydrogenase n=1 Tax=Halomarina ordinaria TaxID=3033939 RepID=A0ABD5UKN5_9EURY|nr:nucleotide sugar dehydrogenase [Halomarina sp. PSRA2]
MATVCVHGLGYVGLPTAALLAHNGHDVTGFDVDEAVIDRLSRGDVRTGEAELREYIAEVLDSGALTPADEIPAAEFHLVCVPTPLDAEAERAELAYVRSAAEGIAGVLREGDTVVLESTVPPGTTEGPLREVLETGSGLRAGTDFGLAYSPETVLPGNILYELRANDRFVGGVGEASTETAARLYEPCIDGTVHRAPDASTAEFVKLVQNAYRDTNIGFANELARVAADYDIDTRTAIGLANRHARVDILQPGPGVGGHCLPVDPLFLAHGSESVDLIRHARRVNDSMTGYVVDLVREYFGGLDGKRLAVLGVAYKGNVDDTRNSPGLRLARLLRAAEQEPPAVADGGTHGGIETRLHDPHVSDDDGEFGLVPLETALDGADAAIVTTDHDEFTEIDPADAADRMRGRLLVDTKGLVDDGAWRDAGFDVITL